MNERRRLKELLKRRLHHPFGSIENWLEEEEVKRAQSDHARRWRKVMWELRDGEVQQQQRGKAFWAPLERDAFARELEIRLDHVLAERDMIWLKIV